MDQDTVVKRAKFIQSSVEIRKTFQFAAPEEVVRSLKIYCNSFYGSNLQDVGGDKAKQVFNAWNTSDMEKVSSSLAMLAEKSRKKV